MQQDAKPIQGPETLPRGLTYHVCVSDSWSSIFTSFAKLPSTYDERRSKDSFRHWFSSKDKDVSDISLGAPKSRPENGEYVSPAGIRVTRKVLPVVDVANSIKEMVLCLDDTKGAILTSSYEFPGRYARWTVGFTSPPLAIEGVGMNFTIKALNARGRILLNMITSHLAKDPGLFCLHKRIQEDQSFLAGSIIPSVEYFPEEERSCQPTLFSLVR